METIWPVAHFFWNRDKKFLDFAPVDLAKGADVRPESSGRAAWHVWGCLVVLMFGCDAERVSKDAGPTVVPAGDAARMAAAPLAHTRSVTVTCTARVNPPADGARRVDLWVPLPASDESQRIDGLHVQSALPYEIQSEREYGNQVAHVWNDRGGPVEAVVRFHCVRTLQDAMSGATHPNPSTQPSQRLLRPDKLAVVDDQIRDLAEHITSGKTGVVEQARAIYEYVVDHMAYDKQTPGWGRGDTLRACKVRKGNCTDFHSLFISLARAKGIPCRFEIGFSLPPGISRGPIEGYHCWAEFWSPRDGWVPVDASKAWEHPERRAFYFGSLDADRVRMSSGRDVLLPGMLGEPLNYFVSPYAEANGRPLANVEHSVEFFDTGS